VGLHSAGHPNAPTSNSPLGPVRLQERRLQKHCCPQGPFRTKAHSSGKCHRKPQVLGAGLGGGLVSRPSWVAYLYFNPALGPHLPHSGTGFDAKLPNSKG
jgi:hypothetical protein